MTARAVDEACPRAHSHCAHRTTRRHRGTRGHGVDAQERDPVDVAATPVGSAPDAAPGECRVPQSLHINATSPTPSARARAPAAPTAFLSYKGF